MANHKPQVKGTDWAIWRRIRLIPFIVTIPEQERDPGLPDKLGAELPGILAWAVQGCLDWQRAGMQVPAIVTAATAEYRAESDVIGSFLDECTLQKPGLETTAGSLYKAYTAWCTAAGHHAQNQTQFGRALVDVALRKRKAPMLLSFRSHYGKSMIRCVQC